jgi:transcriptional regulator GlxA family with amidase domain
VDSQQNQQRIKTIYRMLLEIANGNLAFRIPLDGKDKPFDELAALLNEVAEELQSYGYTNPYNKNRNTQLETNQTATVLIQKVLDYIQNHLEEPLPSTKELSVMFGTNEFTLKDSFRNVLQTSIYQFYNEERLKKAHLLLQQTGIPFKEIALMSGFTNYTNFYKAFKKRYDYSPSELQRTTSEHDNS